MDRLRGKEEGKGRGLGKGKLQLNRGKIKDERGVKGVF